MALRLARQGSLTCWGLLQMEKSDVELLGGRWRWWPELEEGGYGAATVRMTELRERMDAAKTEAEVLQAQNWASGALLHLRLQSESKVLLLGRRRWSSLAHDLRKLQLEKWL